MSTDILVSDITDGAIDTTNPSKPFWSGNGVFDKLINAFNENIQMQKDVNRLTGKDFAEVYLGGVQSILAQSTNFVLQEKLQEVQIDNLTKELELKEAQLALTNRQLVKLEQDISLAKIASDDQLVSSAKDRELKDGQINSINRDISLKEKQIDVTERDQLNKDEMTDKELELKDAQIAGTNRDTALKEVQIDIVNRDQDNKDLQSTKDLEVKDINIASVTRDIALKEKQIEVIERDQDNKDDQSDKDLEVKSTQITVMTRDAILKENQANAVSRDIVEKELSGKKDREVKDAQKVVTYRDAMIKEQQQQLLFAQTSYETAKTDVLNQTRIDNLLIKDAEILNNSIQGYSQGGLIPPTGLLTSSSAITTEIADRAGLTLDAYGSIVYTHTYTSIVANRAAVIGEIILLDDVTYKSGGTNDAKGQFNQRYMAQTTDAFTASGEDFTDTVQWLALD